ncbi:MAG TPA: dephospho-CoA kinase, partial [Burkholderiales bacterium]|nr:dephospho-CoA kinase [Burkholderiales bacterium]
AVGLTGGIGSGKTTVSELFAELGAGVVDADEIAHALTGPGQAAVGEIARRFGPQYLRADGTLDRTRMRKLAFEDARAKKDLESILHPLIRHEAERRLASSTAPYAILVVPLLFESGAYQTLLQRVLVVDSDQETRIERVKLRSNLSRDEILAIMAAQVGQAERLRRADDVIRNDGDVAALAAQVAVLHRKYLDLAADG